MKLLIFFDLLVILCGVVHISHGENLNCAFGDWRDYACKVTSIDNSDNTMVITGYSGIHETNKNDTDVKSLYIHDSNTKYIPKNLGLLFNLTSMEMYNTQLIEIKTEDFIGMQDLEHLNLHKNKLGSIPVDSFYTLTKLKNIYLDLNQLEEIKNGVFEKNLQLERIHLWKNQIKFLGSSVFDGLTKLNIVELRGNICIDKIYEGSSQILQLNTDIKLKCISSFDSLDEKLNEIRNMITNLHQIGMNKLNDVLLKTEKFFFEFNSKLEQTNVELSNTLLSLIEQKRLDQLEINNMKKESLNSSNELKKYLNESESYNTQLIIYLNQKDKESDVKLNLILNKVKNMEQIGNETLLKSEKSHQQSCKLEQGVNDLNIKLKYKNLNEKNVKLELELYALNMEILEAKELRQSDRMVIIETKKQLLKANEQLSNCDKDVIIDL